MSASGFLSNRFVKNILAAIVLVVVLVLGASLMLRVLTHHNQEIMVPDFTGMSLREASRAAASADIRIDVADSIYVKRVPKGSVVRQEPKPGQMVKTGRRIMLTINAVNAKQIPMPNLVGYSLRSANAELVSRGLELGKLIYVRDMATNNVLRQLYRNSEISAGRMIPSESRIDLVLGLNDEDNVTSVPNLYGTKYRFALEKIHDHSLNIGNVVFDKDIRTYQDSVRAVVYRQKPDPLTDSNMGRNVSIYLTLDETKVPKPEVE